LAVPVCLLSSVAGDVVHTVLDDLFLEISFFLAMKIFTIELAAFFQSRLKCQLTPTSMKRINLCGV
jgi:hypothetical protein